MYRQRIRQQILYGQFREYAEIAAKVIALRQKLGLAPATCGHPHSAPQTRSYGRSTTPTSPPSSTTTLPSTRTRKQWNSGACSGNSRSRVPHRTSCSRERRSSR